MLTHTSSQGNRPRKGGRLWCDHCKKTGHFRETCWKIHGKPADWKPRPRANIVATAEDSTTTEGSPFSKSQLEALQKLFGQPIPGAHVTMMSHQDTTSNTFSAKSINPWIVDSGDSDHMLGDLTVFHTFKPCINPTTVRIADGSLSSVMGTGFVQITDGLLLSQVLYVPKLSCNLLSISKLTRDLNCVT